MRCCILRRVETQKQLIIGTDGTRRQNILPLQSSPTSRVELAGWWEQKNTFAVASALGGNLF